MRTSPSTAMPARIEPAKRAPDLARANVFNRLYVAAMFCVIIAIGSFGIDVIARSQATDAHVAQTFQRANDVSEMRTALDREDFELLSELRQRQGIESDRLVRATELFDGANGEVNRDGWTANEPLLNELASRQAGFVSDSQEIAGALANGNYARAARIDAQSARPNVNAMRFALDKISGGLFRASVADAASARRFMWDLQHLIGAVTLLGLGLMAGFAVLLGRYKRAADTSAAATLAALEQAALTDSLTELGNNRAFYDDFEREIARAKRHDHAMVLALIDIDDFKAVNDKDGHSHGDDVLALVGERLRTARQEDRGYRIGGDEFALILTEADPKAAATALSRLQKELREALLGATVSIGYVNLAGPELVAGSYDLADAALYEAKRAGRNRTVCFRDSGTVMNVFSPAKGDIVRKMISEQLITMVFQPIWDMESNRPLGFEALMRPNPGLGLTGPQEAFDVAERIRQLPQLDRVCMHKMLASSANLPPDSTIFLNYSPTALLHQSFDPDEFVAEVRAAGRRPEQIVVEVSERRIDDAQGVIERAKALRALGVRIALDNIGSGHAGLEIMSKLHLDFVKLDRELVSKAIDNNEARGVLAGLIAIARESGSYLIAEGIETQHMLDFVSKAHVPVTSAFAGVRGVQGYELGKPEAGRIDPQTLQDRHEYLQARRGEISVAAERRSDRSDDRSALREPQATP